MKIYNHIFIFIFYTGILYLVLAFCNNTFNPNLINIDGKIPTCILWIVLIGVQITIIFDKKKQD